MEDRVKDESDEERNIVLIHVTVKERPLALSFATPSV